jgi:hypothetical protein
MEKVLKIYKLARGKRPFMKGRERFMKTEWCTIMRGFDGEYYVFNERDIGFIETDEIGAYALGLVDGKRELRQIISAVDEKYTGENLCRDEISRRVVETFEAAVRLGAIKRKRLPW